MKAFGFFIVIFMWICGFVYGYFSQPKPLPTPPITIHDTTIVREEIFKCGPVKHDTIIIHVKD